MAESWQQDSTQTFTPWEAFFKDEDVLKDLQTIRDNVKCTPAYACMIWLMGNEEVSYIYGQVLDEDDEEEGDDE